MAIKHYITHSLLLAALTVSTSCEFRDAPMDKVSEEVVWTSPILLDEYANAWYQGMSNGFNTWVPSTIVLVKSMSRYYMPWFADQVIPAKNDYYSAGFGDLLSANVTELTSWARIQWNNSFTQIQSINTLFEHAGSIPDGEQKTRLLGEAHFLRAYYYYMLWRYYGGVILVDHTYDPLKNPETFPRASYQQMVDFIVKDAQQAADLLPVAHTSENVGRATKGAALMLVAKTYLWAASPHFQNQEKSYLGFTGDQRSQLLQQAKTAYEQLFALGAYELVPIAATTQDGIRDEYRAIFLTKNSQESIFEVQHADDGDFANKNGHKLDRDAACPGLTGTTCAYCPTQNHVEEYGMRDGATYNAQAPYDNRDYRFYANILYDGTTFHGHTIDTHYERTAAGVVAGEDLRAYGTSTTAAFTNTGYYMGKFVSESQTIDNDDTYGSSQNYIIWRLAEAKLDYAEVCLALGDAATATQQVNDIRSRVHMDTYTTNVTEAQLRNERRVEMAFEETTYWDILRWNEAVEKLNGATNPLRKIRIVETNGVKSYTYQTGGQPLYVHAAPARRRVFTEKQYYLPIPLAEIQYHQLEQNPGWTVQ